MYQAMRLQDTITVCGEPSSSRDVRGNELGFQHSHYYQVNLNTLPIVVAIWDGLIDESRHCNALFTSGLIAFLRGIHRGV